MTTMWETVLAGAHTDSFSFCNYISFILQMRKQRIRRWNNCPMSPRYSVLEPINGGTGLHPLAVRKLLISCPLSYQASLSEPHRYLLWPSNHIFFRLFPQLKTYKMSPLSSRSWGGRDVLFYCPRTDRDGIKKMGQHGAAYTAKVVTGSLPKLTSTPPGSWTSLFLYVVEQMDVADSAHQVEGGRLESVPTGPSFLPLICASYMTFNKLASVSSSGKWEGPHLF